MPQTNPYQTNQQKNELLKLFVPTKLEIAMYLLLAAILLLLVKHAAIIDSLVNSSNVNAQDFVVSDATTVVVYKITNTFSYFSSFMIWLLAGSFIYLIFWLFRNAVLTLRSDVKGSRSNKTPTGHSYWESAGTKYLAAVAVVVSLFCYFYFFLKILNGLVLDTKTGFYKFSHNNLYLWVLFSVVLIAILLYFLKILLHILVHIFRSFSS